MNNFLQKITLPEGWEVEKTEIENCVVLTHPTFCSTTIDTHKRHYAPGVGKPKPNTIDVNYKGKGWEQRIVNDATSRNASFWNIV